MENKRCVENDKNDQPQPHCTVARPDATCDESGLGEVAGLYGRSQCADRIYSNKIHESMVMAESSCLLDHILVIMMGSCHLNTMSVVEPRANLFHRTLNSIKALTHLNFQPPRANQFHQSTDPPTQPPPRSPTRSHIHPPTHQYLAIPRHIPHRPTLSGSQHFNHPPKHPD